MFKDMENHLELKQKYHMDQLLKAFLTEKKQNKCLEDKIRNSEMEIQRERKIHECQLSEIEVLQQECQQSNERAIQRLERLEHENQQLKTQMNDIRLECQRLKKWENDTLKKSEETD